MPTNTIRAAHVLTVGEAAERRRKPRIREPFPVTVHGVDGSGEAFEINTHLDNLSASGLYLRLAECVEPGMRLFIVIRLSAAPAEEASAPRIAIHGVVLRAEFRSEMECGVAVAFTHHRFL